ncbi:MAG TPA: Sec-independent protein translocase protein TatB [Rhizobiaceae bacterium]|nr:Sec-independent protein translocase protein TatB [Rhizobiaceae bacterium]
MFDIGWSEILVIAVVLIVVVGPKDLPRMLRSFGRTTAKLRAMAGDFRRQFDEALREAELGDVKDTLDSVRGLNPMNEIRKHLSPLEQAGQDVRAGLEDVMKPMPKPDPLAEPIADEPLKTGAAMLPGEGEAASKAKAARKTKAPAAKTSTKGRGKAEAAAATPKAAASKTDARPGAASKSVRAAGVKKAAAASAPAAKATARPAARSAAKAQDAKPAAKSAAAGKDVSPKIRAKAPVKPAVAKKPAARKKTSGSAS